MANDAVTAMPVINEEKEIAGHYPTIIVTGTADKPLFHIVYVSADDGSVHVGFASYELAFVFQWLEEYFGVTRASDSIEELRPRGRWIVKKEMLNMRGVLGVRCSACGQYWALVEDNDAEYMNHFKSCPNCGAKMENGNA